MFEVLQSSKGDLLAVKASGKLTTDDYEKVLIPKLDALLEEHGKVRMLAEFAADFAGWDTMGAAWDDLTLGLKHPNGFKKLALVAAPEWIEWGAKLFGIFMSGEIKAFPEGDRDAALQWLKS